MYSDNPHKSRARGIFLGCWRAHCHHGCSAIRCGIPKALFDHTQVTSHQATFTICPSAMFPTLWASSRKVIFQTQMHEATRTTFPWEILRFDSASTGQDPLVQLLGIAEDAIVIVW